MRRRIGRVLGTAAAVLAAAAWASTAPAAAPTDTELRATAWIDVGLGECSGVLVAPQKVLTAGHCVGSLPPRWRITVLLGARDPRRVRSGFIRTRTWSFILDDKDEYDLALIILPPARAGEGRTPAPPGTAIADAPVGADAVTVGYSAGGRRSRQAPIRRTRLCGRGIDAAVTLCAGRFADRDPPCAGDSGAPLFLGGKVVAILSGYNGGGNCGSVPFVYTRLSAPRARRLIAGS